MPMAPLHFLFLLLSITAVCAGSAFHLFKTLTRDRQLISLIGLFCMAMGFFLLLLDLALIAFTLGPQYIPQYLLFHRLVADTGFAGRWILTVYIFMIAGPIISIYLLARKLVSRFNKTNTQQDRAGNKYTPL
jgi:hypothetical protein